jgi:hypothetical protein
VLGAFTCPSLCDCGQLIAYQVLWAAPAHREWGSRRISSISWRLALSLVITQVQSAVDKRAVDAHLLFQIAGGRVLCAVAEHVLFYASTKVSTALNGRVKRFYSAQIFHAIARLDVPSWDDPVVSAQIDAVVPRGQRAVAWVAIMSLIETGSTVLKLFSQTAVLMGVLREQSDGLTLPLLSFASDAVSFFNLSGDIQLGGGKRHRSLRLLDPAQGILSLGCYHAR